jgi:hypothetical protein
MKFSTECPNEECKAPLTLWRVMAAPTPFHVKCKRCNAKIRAGGIAWPSIAVSLVLIIGLVVGSQRLQAAGELSRRNGVLLLLGLGFVFELLVSLLVVNKAKLTANKP